VARLCALARAGRSRAWAPLPGGVCRALAQERRARWNPRERCSCSRGGERGSRLCTPRPAFAPAAPGPPGRARSAPRLQQRAAAKAFTGSLLRAAAAPGRAARAPRLQQRVVAELGEVRAQAELVADQEALAAEPEQVRKCDACAPHAPRPGSLTPGSDPGATYPNP